LKEWIIQYHRHGKPIPEGFERHDGLDDTHHGHHACLAVQTLCQCGQPLKTIDDHGHVRTACCNQIVSGCCGDV
jgi:hypothetical protein